MTTRVAESAQRGLAPHAFIRVLLSFLSLMLGNAGFWLVMFATAYVSRMSRLAEHPDYRSWSLAPDARWFAIYAIASIIGWLLLGPLIAILLPTRVTIRIHHVAGFALGALLGPASISILMLLLGCFHLLRSGQFDFDFRSLGGLSLYAAAFGAPTGLFYSYLVRRFHHSKELLA